MEDTQTDILEQTFLAKTYFTDAGIRAGLSVYDHCRVVGTIARLLAEQFPLLQELGVFPSGIELVAAVHDIGKISPTFQEKIRRAFAEYPHNSAAGLEDSAIANPETEKKWGYHAGAGALSLKSLFLRAPLINVVARHHGSMADISRYTAKSELLGGMQWQEYRMACVEALKEYFKVSWPTITTPAQEVALSGLTTVADWIGSGEINALEGDSNEDLSAQCGRALNSAGFITPEFKKGLSFQDIFGFTPNAMQETLASCCSSPGTYVLEAPMGLGKTEAALFAAYGLLSSGKARGIYFGLPTRLTSDKIHTRFMPFLDAIVPDSVAPIQRRALLLHGMSLLEESVMGEEAAPGGSWFNSTKRGLLAPFGVGTVDQALMAALPDVRHSFVRAFGLAGKVVILDEVHSYDSYTLFIISNLLSLLEELGCTVFILSATLTSEKRMSLLGQEFSSKEYPLISGKIKSVSALNASHALEPAIIQQTFASVAPKRVTITMLSEREQAMEEAMRRAVDGEQVLWVENTVAEAQGAFAYMAARLSGESVECGLLHSRFTQTHRTVHEDKWVGLYGKGSVERGECGRILVGTQVVEQSLDIDADCLFTTLCPLDMLLQRMGRLWRHGATVRPSSACMQTFVILQRGEGAPLSERCFGASGLVYAPYILYRTEEVLHEIHLGAGSIILPDDIRPLMEKCYASRAEEGVAQSLQHQLAEKEKKLVSQASLISMQLGQALPDTVNASVAGYEERSTLLEKGGLGTRYSDMPSMDVLILYRLHQEKDSITLIMLDGSSIHLPRIRSGKIGRNRQLAARLARQIVSVPSYLAPEGSLATVVRACLEQVLYIGENTFAVGVVDDSGMVRNLDGSPARVGYDITYSEKLGYRANKEREE